MGCKESREKTCPQTKRSVWCGQLTVKEEGEKKINDVGGSDQKGCFCGYDEACTGSEKRPDSGPEDVVNARQNKGGNGRKSYEQKTPQEPLMTGRCLMGSVLCSGVEEG
jgi:hypothetical protein